MARPRVPTLGEIHRQGPGWVWLYCIHCDHKKPFTLAQVVIRWGPDASSDRLRQRARCTKCGKLGATMRARTWGGAWLNASSFFPVDQM